ncbi:MAG: hypothetical protein K1060chlam5_00615 [Candidatus Anoxychlamydiales bacterium]|nr:hypothetical protein [Candidatus Anoxychlamydiales bacterium]
MFEDFEEDTSRHLSTDHEIDQIFADDESLAYGFYSMLITYEDHYNNIQNKYKGLTITWVLATFIAIGYMLSGYEKALFINPLLIILFLTILSSFGVCLLWFLDAGVYESLIFSIWQETHKLEEKHSSLGKSHHLTESMFKGFEKQKIFHGVFYAYLVFFLLFIGICSLSIYLFFISKWMPLFSIPLVLSILFIINKYSKTTFRK